MVGEMEKELLDWGVKIGVQARASRVEKHQLENLIASLDSTDDPRKSLLITAVFARRQAARRERPLDPLTARLVVSAMHDLYGGGYKQEHARKMLGFAKWVYESAEQIRVERDKIPTLTLESFIGLLREKGERA